MMNYGSKIDVQKFQFPEEINKLQVTIVALRSKKEAQQIQSQDENR